MPFWLIIVLVFFGISYLFLGIICFCNYRTYNNRTKPPTGQVPVEERCVIPKEEIDEYIFIY